MLRWSTHLKFIAEMDFYGTVEIVWVWLYKTEICDPGVFLINFDKDCCGFVIKRFLTKWWVLHHPWPPQEGENIKTTLTEQHIYVLSVCMVETWNDRETNTSCQGWEFTMGKRQSSLIIRVRIPEIMKFYIDIHVS